jgi:DNA-directed RNA polymerase specialized sigma24 family protein
VKRRINPAHYEMYHLHVIEEVPVRETARVLGVSAAAVYVAKHRVGGAVKKELRRIVAAAPTL